jgi:hypothetical protein
MSKSISELVAEFAKHCLAQREALNRDDVAVANRHADKNTAAWHALVDAYGDAGRDGVATLFKHPSVEVRVLAAAYLLRYKTEEAIRVLEEAKATDHFGAEQALERWREGTWQLDPAPASTPEE